MTTPSTLIHTVHFEVDYVMQLFPLISVDTVDSAGLQRRHLPYSDPLQQL